MSRWNETGLVNRFFPCRVVMLLGLRRKGLVRGLPCPARFSPCRAALTASGCRQGLVLTSYSCRDA